MFANPSGLSKTELSDLFLYGPDASEILSFSSGEIDMQLCLHGSISKGVYSICSSKKYLTDYLLFAVNLEDTYINYPGVYAALTPEGIVFTIWTMYGRFSVIDTITDITESESFVISFCWDSSGEKLGSGATMAIFVNDGCTVSSNFMIDTPSMSGLKFYALDSNNINFNTLCVLQNFACFSSLPENRLDLVKILTNFRKSDIEFVLGTMKGSLLWSDFSKTPIVLSNVLSPYISRYSMGICDITGNLYFSTCFNDDFDSSYVSKLSGETSKITHVLKNLKSPVSISVIQKDAINYPRNIYYDSTTCDGVWIASRDKLIRTDSDLNVKVIVSGFGRLTCIQTMNDKSCWISDKTNNVVRHYSYSGSLIGSVSISTPIYMSPTIRDDLYVYSETQQKIVLIHDGIEHESLSFGEAIAGFDTNMNNGMIVVGFSDGRAKTYSRSLVLEEEFDPMGHIDTVMIKRGYLQDSVTFVDSIAGKIKSFYINDLTRITGSLDFDRNVIFNGSLASTARVAGISVGAEADFDLEFGVGKSIIEKIDSGSYKVVKRNVDLSGGKEASAYFDVNGISSERDPTDYQGDIFEVVEIENG